VKRSRVRAVVIAISVVGCLLVLVVAFGLYALHFNPFTGTYSYDPRTEKPIGFFALNRPEDVLVQTLQRQIARDGSFPAGDAQKLIAIEPVRVEVSIYSDWAASARVTTRLHYQDGSVSTEAFRFRDAGSLGMLNPIAPGGEMKIYPRFGNLGDCQPEAAGSSYCGFPGTPVEPQK
jgi:hypothetical protein